MINYKCCSRTLCCYCNAKATEYHHWVEANLENSYTAQCHAQIKLDLQSILATESSEFTDTIVEDSISTAIDLPVEHSSNINDAAISILNDHDELQLQFTHTQIKIQIECISNSKFKLCSN